MTFVNILYIFFTTNQYQFTKINIQKEIEDSIYTKQHNYFYDCFTKTKI